MCRTITGAEQPCLSIRFPFVHTSPRRLFRDNDPQRERERERGGGRERVTRGTYQHAQNSNTTTLYLALNSGPDMCLHLEITSTGSIHFPKSGLCHPGRKQGGGPFLSCERIVSYESILNRDKSSNGSANPISCAFALKSSTALSNGSSCHLSSYLSSKGSLRILVYASTSIVSISVNGGFGGMVVI